MNPLQCSSIFMSQGCDFVMTEYPNAMQTDHWDVAPGAKSSFDVEMDAPKDIAFSDLSVVTKMWSVTIKNGRTEGGKYVLRISPAAEEKCKCVWTFP